MRDRFSEIQTFVHIAESGSLSEAAQRLEISIAAASRRLARLEARLGVPLIRRNSRSLTLTEEGFSLHEKAGRALNDMEQAEQAVMRDAGNVSGSLKVVTTTGFGRKRLAPALQHYAMLHPDVEVKVHLETSGQAANIIATGYDLAICFEQQPDSSLTMKRLTDNPRVMCAAPDYLERRGRPRHVDDLEQHDHIVTDSTHQDSWRHANLGHIRPKRALTTNDGELSRIWALGGAGIAIESLWDVREDLAEGRLEAILPAMELPGAPIVALYTAAQGGTANVRSCISFLAEHFRRSG